MKEEGRFVYKSALIEKILRTLTIIYHLTDLDELSIFCHKIGSPECFLKMFCPPKVRLLYTLPPFYADAISTVELASKTAYAESIALETRYKTSLEHGVEYPARGTFPRQYPSVYRLTHPSHLGGIARKPRPPTAERCSIGLTDLADFPTGDTYI